MTDKTALEIEIADMVVSVLALDVSPGAIDPDDFLFGAGLGLDSIDALELALEIDERYGVEIRAEDEENEHIFRSLRALAAHIGAKRTK